MCMPNNYAQQVQGNIRSSVGGLVGEAIKEKDKPKPVETDKTTNKEAKTQRTTYKHFN